MSCPCICILSVLSDILIEWSFSVASNRIIIGTMQWGQKKKIVKLHVGLCHGKRGASDQYIHRHVICDAANVAILQQHYTIDSFHSNNFT